MKKGQKKSIFKNLITKNSAKKSSSGTSKRTCASKAKDCD